MSIWKSSEALDLGYPFEYDEAILYHGSTREIFYNRNVTEIEDRNDFVRNPNSVLNQRYLTAGNGCTDWLREQLEENNFSDIEINHFFNRGAVRPGVYCGFLTSALYFAICTQTKTRKPGIVLKLKVPTDELRAIYYTNECLKNETDNLESFPFEDAKSSEELSDKLGKIEYRKYLDYVNQYSITDVKNNNVNASLVEALHFSVDREVPLDWVEGVWDLNLHDAPNFYNLSEYVKILKNEVPEKLPSGMVKKEKYHNFLLELIETLEEGFSDILFVGNYLRNHNYKTRNLKESKELEERIIAYRNKIDTIEREVSNILGNENIDRLVISNYPEFKSFLSQNKLKEGRKGIKQLEIDKEKLSGNKPRKEFLYVCKEDIVPILEKMPRLKPATDKEVKSWSPILDSRNQDLRELDKMFKENF